MSQRPVAQNQCQVEQVLIFLVLNMSLASKALVICLHSANMEPMRQSELIYGISWG